MKGKEKHRKKYMVDNVFFVHEMTLTKACSLQTPCLYTFKILGHIKTQYMCLPLGICSKWEEIPIFYHSHKKLSYDYVFTNIWK